MKQTFTSLLPLAASLLLCVPTTQAQVSSSLAARKAATAGPVQLQQLPLSAGAPAARPALPMVGGMAAKHLLQQRSLAGAKSKAAARTSGDQARSSTTETVTQAWVARYREVDNAAAGFTRVDMEVDAAGNTYVAGYFTTGDDYVTAKISPSGQLVWERYYNGAFGTSTSTDRPVDLVLDGAGNVIVTGTSFITPRTSGTPNTREDFATIKYSPSGQTLWVSRFDGGSNQDVAVAVTVDAADNVYVTGATIFGGFTSARNSDIVTVKYSANGAQQWNTSYSNTTNNGSPNAVAVDAAGEVYVARGSTIFKYAQATGQLVWTAFNQGSVNPDLTDLVVDAAGDLLATGPYATTTNGINYATRKYAKATGQVLWQALYNGPGNATDEPTTLAVDANNNVFVTGFSSSGTSNEFATIKYSATGQQLWLARYNGTASNGAQGLDMVLDAAGNAYVTGPSRGIGTNNDYSTVKYSSSGQQLWEARYNGPVNGVDVARHIGLDAAGNVYVGGDSDYAAFGGPAPSFTVVKYEQPSVQELWEARFTGAGSSAEVAKDVVSDAAGNVYVTGYAYNGRNYDYATVKYNASGQQQWQARYNGPADNEDLPTNVVVDAAGNVYVSGTSYSASESDYATVKYSPTGQQLWVARYNGPASGYDLAAKVEVDRTGNVYVTGSSDNGASSSYDYATVKYDANGQPQWATRYNGPANSFDLAADLAVDVVGNVYVTGTTYTDTQSDYATLKYDGSTGSQLQEARYNGPGNGYDEAAKLAIVEPRRWVVVTGTSDGGSSTGFDIATVLYDAEMMQQEWVNRYNRLGNGDDVAAKVVVSRQEDYVYVAGTSFSSAGADYATAKYAVASGQLLWSAFYNGPANSYEEAKSIAVDAAGNAYVTGLSYNSDGTDDYATVKYAANASPNAGQTGRQLWTARYDGAGSYDEAAALAVDASNNVYVTGYSLGTSTGYDYATLKYSQNNGGGPLVTNATTSSALVAGAPLAVATPRSGLQELSVYPNPTTGPTTVSFRPVAEGIAQVQLYNQLGQQVATLYEGHVHKGQHYELPLNSEHLASGLYTCSLLVNGQRETVRLLINR